jgi:hypothetical protein
MQTIIKDGVSVYLFSDERKVNLNVNKTVVKEADAGDTKGKRQTFHIADCDQNNATLIKNVTAPEDWEGGKYFFDGITWTLKE